MYVPNDDKMSSLLRTLWETEPLRELGGQRLGRLNSSPSCLDVNSPGTWLHVRTMLTGTFQAAQPVALHR